MSRIVIGGFVLLSVALLRAQVPTADEKKLANSLALLPTDQQRRELLAHEHSPTTPGLIQALILEGKRLVREGKYPASLALYRFDYSLAEASGDKEMQSSCLYSMTTVLRQQGDYEEALDAGLRSLEMAREFGSPSIGIADRLEIIGTTESYLGDHVSGLKHVQEALALAESSGDRHRTNMFRTSLANVYILNSDYRAALENYEKSMAAGTSPEGKVMLLNNVGVVYEAQGNLELALDYYLKCLQQADGIHSKAFTAEPLLHLGSIYRRTGKDQLAIDYLQRALQVGESEGDHDVIAQTHLDLGKLQQAQGRPEEAKRSLDASASLYRDMHYPANESLALSSLAAVEETTRQYTNAAAHANQALTLARDAGDPAALWNALNAAATVNGRLGKRSEARTELLEAIQTVESLSARVAGGEQDRERFFEDKLAPYQALVKISLDDHKPKDALAYAERAKARVLRDALRDGHAVISKAMTADEKSRERTLLGRMAALNNRWNEETSRPASDRARTAQLQAKIDAARLEYAAFQSRLYALHPELRRSRLEGPPTSVEEMAALLPDEQSAALEYVVTENQTFVFVVSKKAPLRQLSIPIPAAELSSKVRRFSEKLGRRDLDFDADSQELYRLLVEPVADSLRDRKTLVIIPDGILWQLPFQALSPVAGHYLIERASVFYAPSLTVLSEMLRRHPPRRDTPGLTLMALGNPTVAAGSLPEAQSEVTAVGQIYGAANSKVLVGEEATEAAFKQQAGRYAILHVAAHAVLDDRSPLYSHLVLAPGSASEDGMLEAREMMDLDLKARIVVLSACETARGRISGGEGLIGMTWALFIAGSPATVAASWKIDSSSAARFTVEFHRRMKEGLSNAAAVRQAALAVMKLPGYEHPYYWSGFSLVGQGF